MVKKEVIAACISNLQLKVDHLQSQLHELRISAESESKSTSGDKHETGRAMIHLEQEQLTKQLGELNNQLSQMHAIKQQESKPNVHSGSLVVTNNGVFFFGVAIGKLEFNSKVVMAISLISPLGKLFAGKAAGDTIQFGDRTYEIISVE